MKTQEDVLRNALKMLEEKQKEYGDAPNTIGPVLDAMFPHGLMVQGRDEFAQLATFMNCIAKLNRYAQNMGGGGGHGDSALDLVNYAAMLYQRTFDDSK